MRWIGQGIYDLIARFRSDVFLESLSTTTETNVLVVDSDGKISKSTSVGGDITSVVAGLGLSGGGTASDVTLTVALGEYEPVVPTGVDSFMTLDGDGSAHQLTTITALATFLAGAGMTADGVGAMNVIGGNGITANANDIAVTAANTNITSLTNAALTLGRDAHNLIDFSTDNQIKFKTNNETPVIIMKASGEIEATKFDGALEGNADTATNLTASTSTAVGLGTIELGHASDTTLARSAAGIMTVEGKEVRTADRQIQAVYTSFQADDIDTKHYLAFNDGDSENTSAAHVDMPIVAPVAGKLLSVSMRISRNLSGDTYTLRLETQAAGVTFGTGPTIVGTQSGAGPTNTSMVTYDFTSSLDSGDNIIDAGDVVHISIQSGSSAATTKYYFTCLFEWDYSSI